MSCGDVKGLASLQLLCIEFFINSMYNRNISEHKFVQLPHSIPDKLIDEYDEW